MDKRLKELIDERIFGIKREKEIDKKVREWALYERRQREFVRKYDGWGSKMRRLLVGDGGLGWSWREWWRMLWK